jgi:hypothetical protein
MMFIKVILKLIIYLFLCFVQTAGFILLSLYLYGKGPSAVIGLGAIFFTLEFMETDKKINYFFK